MKNKETKICFIPFYAQCPQHRHAASARFRAEWPAKYLKADLASDATPIGDLLEYDLVVFQKCYSVKFQAVAEYLRRNKPEIRLAFDLCDAEWTAREIELKDMIARVDFVTVPTDPMKEWIGQNFPEKPCHMVPDGHDIDYYFTESGEPEIDQCGPMRYVWYGNSGTIKSLEAILGYLEAVGGKGDTLTVIANDLARGAISSDKIGIRFATWKLETVNAEIKKGNLALNPRMTGDEAYRYKSNNKTATAYILGLPCIERWTGDEIGWTGDLMEMRSPELRMKDLEAKRHHYLKNFRMENVVKLWKKAFDLEFKK